MNKKIDDVINIAAESLADIKSEYINKCRYSPPTAAVISNFVLQTAEVIFPGYIADIGESAKPQKQDFVLMLKTITDILIDQCERALYFDCDNYPDCECLENKEKARQVPTVARSLAARFIEMLPELRRRLLCDVEAMLMADPAVKSFGEVIFCYPTIVAMTHHRIAHALHTLGLPLVPRMIAEIAHSKTGIDIHPAAQIDDYFAIDHGTGVVIGETAIIGKHVVIYQGVTLGAKSFQKGEDGRLLNVPRHPIIEDNVKIYSNASILGRITVGRGSIIGGNTWIDQDVEPNSKIIQLKR